ncbi:MAG: putative 3-oxoacyl-acyl-carrier-protein reductase [Alphaproteobacteria bacterium]|nr:MAG: putative 3-oxoacyl-acyl-carrier-protein reductase [Alphaproteobacteria bacterium]
MSNSPSASVPPVAVVGMSAIYPGESGLAGYWRTIVSGRNAISDVPASHWLIDDYYDPDPAAQDKTYCKRGGFIQPVSFDPMQFGLPPNALPATDSAQILALIAAKQALDQASRGQMKVDPDRISVVLGVASTTELVVHMGARLQRPVWRKALIDNGMSEPEADAICDDIAAEYAPWQESTFPGLLGNVVAGRVANRLNLGGANFVTDAACASSLSALQVALHQLYLNEADMVLTGGVDALNDIMMFMCFSKTPAFSLTGDCRPFSDAADGTIIGEGVGMLALKRLSDAERDGDVIHAVVRGLGSSSDGRASSVYAPRPEGQAKALRRAYQHAGYAPATVELLEAHGTATKAGDVAEFSALSAVFAESGDQGSARCALGSVKSQIGHTKAAAGAAGLIKAVLALQHATLPGTIKVGRPNASLKVESTPFYINAQTRPWVRDGSHPRRASVSSFGFGGSNFHVALEEYRGPMAAKRVRALPCELILLSAESATGLAERCSALVALCVRGEGIGKIAFDAAASFETRHGARAGVVAADPSSLQVLLNKLRAALESDSCDALKDADIAVSVAPPREGRTAFLFPGQGSHYVGMGADLALAFPQALSVWDRIAGQAAVSELPSIVFPEPAFDAATREQQAAALTAMVNAQPAIAATSLAQLALLERLGVHADVFGGHSFGEVTALAAACSISRDNLISVARVRGELMTQAAGAARGAMLAVAAGAAQVEALLARDPGLASEVAIANDNAPLQIVLSGSVESIERAESVMKAERITTFRLPVASAFHSPIVAASCEPFAAFLKSIKFGKAKGDVYSNANAKPYGRSPGAQLADQLQRPVRFREMIEAMAAAGVTRFIEVGPGRILTALVDQILPDTPHLAVALDDRKAGALRGWSRGLAALAADGVVLDFAALFESYEQPEAAAPAPAHAVLVGGANLGKPYPPQAGSAPRAPRLPPLRLPAHAPREATLPIADALAAPLMQIMPMAPQPAFQTAASAGRMLEVDVDGSHDAWSIIDRIQAETVDQHRHYLDVMARSHEAFLQMSAQMLDHIMGNAPSAPPASRAEPLAPIAAPIAMQPPPHVAVETPPPLKPSSAPGPAARPEDVVLAIVAEKTGYPMDMLQLDMEMEAELGIDSIKQVEILSGVQERFPGAPEIPASDLSALKTLRDVVNAVSAVATAQPPGVARVADLTSPPPPSPDALRESVLSIVAEKTGYPQDMLNLDMEMEAELGIDSIKQVEILSALQERWPNAPEVSASDLAGLKTLRDVSNALASIGSPSPAMSLLAGEEVVAVKHPPSALAAAEVTLVERMPSGFAMAGLLGDVVVNVTKENPAFADEVVSELEKRGISALAVDVVPPGASAVISLAALARVSTAVQSLELHLNAFRAAQVVARSENAARLFATVQSTDGCSGSGGSDGRALEFALSCGVAGLAKTAAREWENGSTKAIDMQVLDASRLVDELLAGGPELEVALTADGRRHIVSDRLATLASEEASIPAGGVVVVSGGARGVTARCAMELAKKKGVRLALLGRTVLDDAAECFPGLDTPAAIAGAIVEASKLDGRPVALSEARQRASLVLARREIASTLEFAARTGIEARYYCVDVASAEEVSKAVAEIRSGFGAIVGIIHGAGVLADRRLADLEEAQFEFVFLPKVAGAEALLAATRDDDLRMVAFFSSVAARTGNAGQGAYAAANEVLNAIAARERARRGPSCAVRAFGWGPWDGGMVDASLRKHFERAGVGLIDIEIGAAFFADEACRLDGAPAIVVSAPGISPLRHAHIDWSVSARALPPLFDHVVQDRIVLPVVVALERVMRAAQALAPSERSRVVVRDFQVLSGVTLSTDAGEEVTLSIAFEPKGAAYAVTLRDSAQRLRYRAVVELRDEAPARPPRMEQASAGPWGVTLEQAYAGPLFHGARFEALSRLEGTDSRGGVAIVKRCTDLGWPDEPWATDPAALDGGLQLGLLWASANKRGTMLPQRIASFAQYSVPAPSAPLQCSFTARPVSEKRIDFDFVLETVAGDLVAVMSGTEFYALGAGVAATP